MLKPNAMSVCAKLQLSSWSRSGWIVCVGWGGGGEHVATMSNSNAFAELRWVLTISIRLYIGFHIGLHIQYHIEYIVKPQQQG